MPLLAKKEKPPAPACLADHPLVRAGREKIDQLKARLAQAQADEKSAGEKEATEDWAARILAGQDVAGEVDEHAARVTRAKSMTRALELAVHQAEADLATVKKSAVAEITEAARGRHQELIVALRDSLGTAIQARTDLVQFTADLHRRIEGANVDLPAVDLRPALFQQLQGARELIENFIR